MNDLFKYFIGILIGVIIVLLIARPKYNEYNHLVNKLNTIEIERDNLNIKLDSLILHYDSLLLDSNIRLDSIQIDKTKTITYYENKIRNLSDVSIVSNDSITSYISSKIHNR